MDEHFDLGELITTRIVRETTGETHLSDHEDTLYLPLWCCGRGSSTEVVPEKLQEERVGDDNLAQRFRHCKVC